MSDREKILETIRKENSFYIISHMLPDGDSIGSLIAMGLGLLKAGKNVEMYTPGHLPLKFSFLKGSDLVSSELTIKDQEKTVIVLDSSDAERLGLFSDQVMQIKKIINIDHHITNQRFGTLNHVDALASATGEIVYGLLKDLAIELDQDIAEALYVAIATDTGSFKFENTTPETHRVIAHLLSFGISPGTLSQKIFDERPLPFYMLLRSALASLEMFEEGRVAVMTLSKDIRVRSGASPDDLDGIVNYSKNIEGVELGILFYVDNANEVKVGFRSKQLDVSVLAGRLNGGGHVRAAGCRMQGDFEQVKDKVLSEAFQMLRQLSA